MLAALAAGVATPVRAQVAARAVLTSDYRYRGVSLSDGKPSASLSLSYDHDSGLYAGATVTGVIGPRGDARLLGTAEYVGYARHFDTGTAWDIGATHAKIDDQIRADHSFEHTEIYAGLIRDHASAHLYYSPNYFGQGAATVYVDVDGAFRPARRWRLFGHVGALTPLEGRGSSDIRRERYDLRAGAAAEFERGELQLAWTVTGPGAGYPLGQTQGEGALILTAMWFF